MTPFKLSALTFVLAALVAFTVTETEAARKTWAQECNEKPKDERDRCCTTKTLDCYAACFEQFGRTGYRSDQCLKLCKSSSKVCHDQVKATSLPGRSTTTQTQAPKFSRRICCKAGGRYRWTGSNDCRARRGRVVSNSFCRKSGRTTTRRQSVICCKRGGRTSLMSRRECRSRKGRPVNGRHCAKRPRALGRE